MTSHAQPNIPLKTFEFHFLNSSEGKLPGYPGSAWRGAFGRALKNSVCVVRSIPCAECLLKSPCAYSYLFETPLPGDSEKMRKYLSAPHPFVLQLPLAGSRQDDRETIRFNLFGHGQRYLPFVIHAMQKAGEEGIGGHRLALTLESVAEIDTAGNCHTIYRQGELTPPTIGESPPVPPMPSRVEITLLTPVRIKQDNKNLAGREFDFAAFFGNLLRRISMISYFHTDTPLETDFAGLSAKARTVQFSEKQLKWFDWRRYSSRQKTEINMGGVIGKLTLDMRGLDEFWPYLWLGQWTHAGKGTTMGMGAYAISADCLPAGPYNSR